LKEALADQPKEIDIVQRVRQELVKENDERVEAFKAELNHRQQ